MTGNGDRMQENFGPAVTQWFLNRIADVYDVHACIDGEVKNIRV